MAVASTQSRPENDPTRRSDARRRFEEVMCRPFDLPATPATNTALLEFVFGEVWNHRA